MVDRSTGLSRLSKILLYVHRQGARGPQVFPPLVPILIPFLSTNKTLLSDGC